MFRSTGINSDGDKDDDQLAAVASSGSAKATAVASSGSAKAAAVASSGSSRATAVASPGLARAASDGNDVAESVESMGVEEDIHEDANKSSPVAGFDVRPSTSNPEKSASEAEKAAEQCEKRIKTLSSMVQSLVMHFFIFYFLNNKYNFFF